MTSMEYPSESDEHDDPPRIFLLIENPKKSNNLGPILRCAAAFKVTQVVAVGFDKCNTEGSHGASKHVEMLAYPTLPQALNYIRKPLEDGGCGCTTVIGLMNAAATGIRRSGAENEMDEIDGYPIQYLGDDMVSVRSAHDNSKGYEHNATVNHLPKSYPVHTKPFPKKSGNVCIVLNKKWKGLPLSLANVCDFFVHVVHAPIMFDADDTKPELLLDVPSCLSILLHHLTQWAKYHERVFQGHKFQVANVQRGRTEMFLNDPVDKSTRRMELKQENTLAAELSVDALGAVFDESNSDY